MVTATMIPSRVAPLAVVLVATALAPVASAQSFAQGAGPVSPQIANAAPLADPLPGLDSPLSDMVRARTAAAAEQRVGREAQVQVEIHLNTANRRAVRERVAGIAEVTKESADGGILQAWTKVGDLEELAGLAGVGQVRRPPRARALGSPGAGAARSEGSDFFEVRRWHDAGFRGDGVGVGIIDIEFLGYRDLLGGDLPAAVAVRNFVDGEDAAAIDGATPHGAAVAEIIHDVAPGARLALARVSTPLDLFDAVEWLVEEQGVDIISTSIGFFNATPGDGTGYFADIVSGAVERGVFWATAAGNSREAHWGGGFTDPDGDGRLDFAGGEVNFGSPAGSDQAFLIPAGFTFWVFLRWDDWVEVDQDYDLFLYRFSNGEWRQQSADGGRDRQQGRDGQFPVDCATRIALGGSHGSCSSFP
jgi:hypothetical protein